MQLLAEGYWLVFLVSFGAYVVFYLLPLGGVANTLKPSALKTLTSAIDSDLAHTGAAAPDPEPVFDMLDATAHVKRVVSGVANEDVAGTLVGRLGTVRMLALAESDEGEGELAEAGEVSEILARNILHALRAEPYQPAAAAVPQDSERKRATERLTRLPSLRADYGGLVQEAVDQIRTQYPDGAYQRFEIERLPSVASFSERVGSARTMAGLFVLLGLFFTMVRLNGVVGSIADAAGGTTMDPAAFLDTMGGLMTGIGGAFDSSIYGLGFLVASLVAIGVIDWVAQRRVTKVESTVVHEVLPALSDLHDRLMPNLTLGDLLAETGERVSQLGDTVGGLTGELDVSLSRLGDRIGNMMDDFKSFQQQYAQLDDLLGKMTAAGTRLADASDAMDGAATRIGDPLASFNKTLLTHVETVVDWVEVSKTGFSGLQREIEAVREHSDVMLARMARAAETGFGETLHEHRQAIQGIELQTAAVEKRLAALGGALDRAGAGALAE